MFKDFKKFVLRGNLVDLAIGFTVGTAFSTVAKSLVEDIIMPPLALLLGKTDFSNLFFTVKGEEGVTYSTLTEAQEAGAVTINYGSFLNNLLALLIVALAMYGIIKAINHLNEQMENLAGKESKEKDKPTTKKCPYCYTTLPAKATRCSGCTSKLTEIK